MGSIYKRGKTWYIDVTCEGRRIRKRAGTSKKIAELAMQDLEVQIARKEFKFDVPDGTLSNVFRSFFDSSQIHHAPATTRRYRNVVKNFEIFLSLRHRTLTRVSQLKPAMLEEYKRFRCTVDPRGIEIPEGTEIDIARNTMIGQPRTINYELKTLGAIFRFGKKQGLCHDNPCENITYLKIKTGETPRFLTNDECRSLLENSIEKYRGVFLTFLLTGLRLGELINLQWGDIDFRRRILKVQRKHDWEPKAGEREVPLNDELVTLLRKRRSPKVEKSDYIFTHEDGRKLGAKLRNTLVSTARRAGIENLTKIHSLRHTFASHLVMKGVDLPTVMKLMGHSDIQTTMIYAHLAPDHLAGAVNKLDF